MSRWKGQPGRAPPVPAGADSNPLRGGSGREPTTRGGPRETPWTTATSGAPGAHASRHSRGVPPTACSWSAPPSCVNGSHRQPAPLPGSTQDPGFWAPLTAVPGMLGPRRLGVHTVGRLAVSMSLADVAALVALARDRLLADPVDWRFVARPANHVRLGLDHHRAVAPFLTVLAAVTGIFILAAHSPGPTPLSVFALIVSVEIPGTSLLVLCRGATDAASRGPPLRHIARDGAPDAGRRPDRAARGRGLACDLPARHAGASPSPSRCTPIEPPGRILSHRDRRARSRTPAAPSQTPHGAALESAPGSRRQGWRNIGELLMRGRLSAPSAGARGADSIGWRLRAT